MAKKSSAKKAGKKESKKKPAKAKAKAKRRAPSPTALAARIVEAGDGLEELRRYDFKGDVEAHDDELTERLCAEFAADVDRIRGELSAVYGKPVRTGKSDHPAVPLNGVFRYALWDVDGLPLFVAAHHEDRGVPIILWIGALPG